MKIRSETWILKQIILILLNLFRGKNLTYNDSITIVRKVSLIFILILSSFFVRATHQVSGYIAVKWLSGTTYQITIYDFTNICNTSADRDTLRIYWGDGTSSALERGNGVDSAGYPWGQMICTCRKINIYSGIHTYPGDGVYRMWFDDPDRMFNILNMSNSGGQDMYLYNTLIISPATGDSITSPVITNPVTCIFACGGECYNYNPGAYSPVGDSISYVLGKSLTIGGAVATGYFIPPANGISGNINLNSVTGTLSWCLPPNLGNDTATVNFVELIVDYKKYDFRGHIIEVPVDTTECELEVILKGDCKRDTPIVTGLQDTCVLEGTNLSLTYFGKDSDRYPLIMSASGEPFQESPPATQQVFGSNPVQLNFKWQTNCSEVRKDPYQLLISVTDNGNPPLNSYYTSDIYVIAPAPLHLVAIPLGNDVHLHWNPDICPQVTGYSIYRHTGCYKWIHSYCETGVPPSSGYSLIGTTSGYYDTTFIDNNGGSGLPSGAYYDYMVVADFPLANGAQSYASLDTCVLIKRDVPVITNVSVDTTNANHGKIFVRWEKPYGGNGNAGLDTTANPPPYKYVLMRAPGISNNNFTRLDSVTSQYFGSNIDSAYTDTGLNTSGSGYVYQVAFYYAGNTSAGASPRASSIVLTVKPDNKMTHLSWISNVPWNDDTFTVYRMNPAPAPQIFNLIATISGSQSAYTDSNLTNGKTYCYYIESKSAYSDISIAHPLFDSSEVMCATPKDTVPPCKPVLNIYPKCEEQTDSLVWHYPNCPSNNNDLLEYKLYFSPLTGADVSLIATITNLADTVYVLNNLNSVAGCYAVVAVDSVLYESPIDTICVDNCPEYRLPNVFTPNGNGQNDYFTPILPYRYVQSIDIDIFNRWGQVMFHTINPEIMWNGNDESSGMPCPDGVYYYVCVVNEEHVTGIKPITLTGFVQILR